MLKSFSRIFRANLAFILCAALCFSPYAGYARSGKKLSLIRDSEIENLLLDYAKPIYKSAGLDAQSVRIIIINDNSINAFVAGGQNLFFNTGLITRAKTPEMLISVIAHEIGHVAAGHLSQLNSSMKDASIMAIAGLLLGVAAVASGLPEAGAAGASLGNHVATREFLDDTRHKEGQADQLALKYLDENQYSTTGFLELLKLLKRRNSWIVGNIDPYSVTHPTSERRISHIEEHINKNPPAIAQVNDHKYKRIQAKIDAYLLPVAKAKEKFKLNNVYHRYAKAIIAFRSGDYTKAEEMTLELLQNSPEDPYYYEFLGEIYYANGEFDKATQAFENALSSLPEDTLISIEKAKSLLASGEIANIRHAQSILQNQSIKNDDEAQIWKLLAASNELLNKQDKKFYNLARYNFLLRNFDKAKIYAKKAKELSQNKNAGIALQAQDILQAIEIEEEKDDSIF